MLQTIEAALREVMPLVFYGTADDVGNAALWNYCVFFRERISQNQSKTGFTDYYTVALVHEDWIPDEAISDTIAALEALPGIRLASQDIDVNYMRKPGTNAVVEIATLSFSHSRKRV